MPVQLDGNHYLTVVFDLKTSAICIDPSPLFPLPLFSACFANQSVPSVRKVKEGPKAGFLAVVEKAEYG